MAATENLARVDQRPNHAESASASATQNQSSGVWASVSSVQQKCGPIRSAAASGVRSIAWAIGNAATTQLANAIAAAVHISANKLREAPDLTFISRNDVTITGAASNAIQPLWPPCNAASDNHATAYANTMDPSSNAMSSARSVAAKGRIDRFGIAAS